jgi:hypothetical protein
VNPIEHDNEPQAADLLGRRQRRPQRDHFIVLAESSPNR